MIMTKTLRFLFFAHSSLIYIPEKITGTKIHIFRGFITINIYIFCHFGSHSEYLVKPLIIITRVLLCRFQCKILFLFAYQNLERLRDELVGGFKQEKNGQF